MLESYPFILILGTALGFLSGIGIGGGSLLILWLTMVLDMSQSVARSINLLFFIPSALVACFFRWRQGAIDWNHVLPAMISGSICAGIFSWVAAFLDTTFMQKLFGGLLILTGLRELCYKPKNNRD